MPKDSRFASQARVELAGSHRDPAPTKRGQAAAPAAGTARRSSAAITVSVIVRRREPIDAARLGTRGSQMKRSDYLRQHGPDPAALKLVKAFAREFGLQVLPDQPGPRTLHLRGSRAAMEKAFGVTIAEHRTPDGMQRRRQGSICLPQELDGAVVAVLGLDNRRQAEPHYRVHRPGRRAGRMRAHAVTQSYTPVQVAQLYNFPANASAAGQTIGILELGGGFSKADLATYFKQLGVPAPAVTAVSVDGGKNAPGKDTGADGEVMLDFEVCAAVAPGAKIAVYFAPNTDQGFIDAITTAVHDQVNKPSVLSISWGGPETSWTGQARSALDAACQSAAALGVTITVASGDNGSSDGVKGGANTVDFPASSPHVLACGGTRLDANGSSITDEVVWNELASNEGATGGGVSVFFPLPAWQASSNVPTPGQSGGGRGVPDVAGDADPATGYNIRVGGKQQVIGGTSAVAPLWAGLIALSNAANGGSAGFVNPALYAASSAKLFRDITQGNNGGYKAAPGWDACTGLGSPVGSAVIAALGKGASGGAGKPPKPPKPPGKKRSHIAA